MEGAECGGVAYTARGVQCGGDASCLGGVLGHRLSVCRVWRSIAVRRMEGCVESGAMMSCSGRGVLCLDCDVLPGGAVGV